MTRTTSFACTASTDITETMYNDVYTGDIVLLPSSLTTNDRDTNGLLTSATLNATSARLKTNNILPNPKTVSTATYKTKVTALLESAKAEYCFYYNRYTASLDYLFSGIRNASSATASAELQTAVQNRLNTTQLLNRKVNDLIQIMNHITTQMMTSQTTLQDEITKFNTKLGIQKVKLEKQNTIIQSNEASMRLQKEMVKYSEEKGRYSDNLLKLYSFLNVVALGLLVYVYKAAGEE